MAPPADPVRRGPRSGVFAGRIVQDAPSSPAPGSWLPALAFSGRHLPDLRTPYARLTAHQVLFVLWHATTDG